MSSQNGQDDRFLEWFDDQPRSWTWHRNFIDVGANDGVTGSNTLALEERGWRGVLVEPNPEMVVQCIKNRRSPVIGVAAWAQSQPLLLEIPGDADKHGLARIPGLPRNSKFFSEHFQSRREIRVGAMCLWDIYRAFFHTHTPIDYLSLDCEGAELEVLKGWIFSPKLLRYICVEHGNRPGYLEELTEFLESKGYERRGIYEQDADFVLLD